MRPQAANGAASSAPVFTPPAFAAPPPEPLPVHPPEEVAAWRAVVEAVRLKRPPLAPVLENATLLRLGPEGATIGFENEFLGRQAQEPSAREIVRAVLSAQLGGTPDVTFEVVRDRNAGINLGRIDSAARRARVDAARRAVVEHPLVTAAIEVLGAELRDVRLASDDAELALTQR